MINLHKQKIKNCFNKSYSTYDQYSHVQAWAGENLIAAVNPVKIKNIIDLGCGTGMTTKKLIKKINHQKFYAIDISEKSLVIAKERLKNTHIKLIENDFENFCFKPDLFDLIFSNMSLQWSLNFKKTLLNINHNMNADSIFAFSLPISGTFVELKNYNKNKFFNEKAIINFLNQSGFKNIYYFSRKIQLKFDSLLKALKYIKFIGANYVINAEKINFPNRNDLHKKFSLTYHIGFFIARKN